MGTDCHVIVVADTPIVSELLPLAVERIELLEDCWSRFRPDSELNRLNAAAGLGPMPVSSDLLNLVLHMKHAWQLSGGLFDPTVLQAVRALGYDADFDEVVARDALTGVDEATLGTTPGMAAVTFDPHAGTVSLPKRVGIDPGAIGKGLAADVVAAELMSAGAAGVLVNLGGDLTFEGVTSDGSPWTIAVQDERISPDRSDRTLRLLEFPRQTRHAGVATSTTLKRRWAQGRRHHVIDPRTGNMSASDLVQVTVAADRAWQAEITATAALLMPADEAAGWLRARDITAILLTADRTIHSDEEVHHG